MFFKQFFDPKLAQYAYLIGCQDSGEAVIIDPMRDIDQYIDAAAENNLHITAAADTHIHADYISGLREFAERGVKVYASDEGDQDWKYEWLIRSRKGKYDYELLTDGDIIRLGNIKIEAWHTPGHTSEHLSYKVTDGATADEPLGLVTGDFIFVGDVGRPDLLETAAGMTDVMKPAARALYKSVEQFKDVPDYVQIWPGHGAGSACGKSLGAIPETTAGYEKRYNNSLKAAGSEEEFVKFILTDQPEPPLYFARMKSENRKGPAIIGGLPAPGKISAEELAQRARQDGHVVLDTRQEIEFLNGHIKGSILTTLNKQFNTVAGSYVSNEENVYLIVDESRLGEAVADLYRVGIDRMAGYITFDDLEVYQKQDGAMDSIEVLDFEEAIKRADAGSHLIDVRKRSERETEGSLKGAVNLAHIRLPSIINDIPKDRSLVIHCAAGSRSAAAAAFLKRRGYDVSVVMDSFARYKENTPATTTA
ncbi:MAG: rhodanese-like domain-containing protein [Balneolales bacterium]